MEKLQDLQLRDIYERYLREHLLGPGYAKALFLCSDDCADEILDKKPQDLYCTGILDPKGVVPINEEIDDDLRDTIDVDEREQRAEGELGITDEDDSDEYRGSSTGIIDRNDRDNVTSSHIGLITSVPENISKISIDISYAKYHQIKDTDRPSVRIRMAELYDSLPKLLEKHDRDDKLCKDLKKIGESEHISSLIAMNQEDNSVQLKKFVPISIPNVMKREDGRDLTVTNQLLQKLFTERLYKRTPVFVKGYEIDLLDECETLKINEDIEIRKKVFTKAQKRYVKLLLCNINQQEYLFQARLRLSPIDGKLMTYTEPVTFARDEERATIDFVYRTVKNYGKGIGCAVEWAEDGSYIQTSYMPHSDVKKFSSAMDQQYCDRIGIDSKVINACCNLYSISHWQSDNEKLLRMLDQFVDAYGKWHEREKKILHNENQPNITEDIETKQKELLDRLRDNVAYLRNNPRALMCFKLANTAMLIQMTVARDPYFRKNRDSIEVVGNNNFRSLEYFKDQGQNHNYYPFQLAFLLMNIKSTFESNDPFRKDVVDMIWFPTGGGKTEAYLALTALTIIARRTSETDEARTAGVSVVMRYTLRLLTSQQFERASYLICALEFLRRNLPQYNLGDDNHPISIGLWIGDSGRDQLRPKKKWGKFNVMSAADRFHANNPYPVTYCPWCGKRLVENGPNYGYNDASCQCINWDCFWGNRNLPIHFVDEDVKESKPTLLFATVDKIAQLYKRDAAELFGVGTEVLPPDLIIQDELHLISGPLGSMVGFFENIVERMCTKDGRSPKIVAATATTRNTSALIKSLYNRDVRVFPAQGNTYEDNFFSHVETQSLRRHLGICPHSVPVQSEVRLISQMALARIVVIRDFLENEGIDLTNPDAVKQCLTDNGQLRSELDNFWSMVLYFNSLKDLGRARSRIAGEIHESLRVRQRYLHIPSSLDFLIDGLTSDMRIKEFTSREDSSRIKSLLTIAETPVTLEDGNPGELRITSATDFVLASNMISVGIDINRWNLMMMSGQPRSTSEYIQSSSRVGRRHHGLVVNLYSPLRIREFSMFENFTSFHAAYYKFVEPLSATPVTLQILNHAILHNIVKCYKQYFFKNLLPDDVAIQEVCDDITKRFHLDEGLEEVVFDRVTAMWGEDNYILFANSLRDIDQDRYIRIDSINYPNR